MSQPEDDSGTFNFHGVRVPALVVSPWIGRGLVPKIGKGLPGRPKDPFFNHSTIIRTIFERFCRDPKTGTIPDVGPRVAAAEHLGWLLNNDEPRMELGPVVRKRTATSAQSRSVVTDSQRYRLNAIRQQLNDARLADYTLRAGKPQVRTELLDQIQAACESELGSPMAAKRRNPPIGKARAKEPVLGGGPRRTS